MNSVRSLFNFLGRLEGFAIAMVLLVLYIALIIAAPNVFTHPLIYISFLETVPPTLIAALGLTLVITAGEIDLSFPAVVSLSGFALSWGWKTFDPTYGAWIGIGLALAAGALVGYINGVMVARIGVPSIMATLAANFFWYGISILLAGGLQVTLKGSQDNFVHELFVGRLFGSVPVQAFWALGLAVLLWFILNRHKFGEGIMFIGDNANVARVMGVNVEATRIRLFALHGMIAAFAGIIVTLDIGVFLPRPGQLSPASHGISVYWRDLDCGGRRFHIRYSFRSLYHWFAGSRRGGDHDQRLLGPGGGRRRHGGSHRAQRGNGQRQHSCAIQSVPSLGGTSCSQPRSRTVTEGRHGGELIGSRLLVCLAFTKGRKPI